MKRVLLTGMSGTGKSTVIRELAARGYNAVDLDCGEWSEWGEFVPIPGVPASSDDPDREWIWQEDRVQALLSTEATDVLFVSGCARNMVKFYGQFDHVVLLSAPTPIIVERLATRTNNPFGKDPDELACVLGYIETVEPLLRRAATHEVDTSIPLDQVVAEVLRFAAVGPAIR